MKKKFLILIFILMVSFIFASCGANATTNHAEVSTTTGKENPDSTEQTEELSIHFIDVGQADCTFIELPNGEEALIDAGNVEDAQTIISYIEGLNVDDIEYLILTHPHEDHIGSAEEIIEAIEVEKVYMPDVPSDSKLYENTMLAIESNNIPVEKSKPGLKIIDIPELSFEILAPKSMYYSELNEYSIVTKLTYQETSFLFTGDAESVSELEMLRGGYDLDSDLLKVGHHGGRTSSSKDFLQAVTPEYSVISSGKDNTYGHPHQETLDRLSYVGSKIYRTDEQGTIIAVSDGENISINYTSSAAAQLEVTAPAAVNNNTDSANTSPTSEPQYIGNKNSLVFHNPSCSSVDDMKETNKVFFLQRQDAIDQGYKPCGKCNP